MKSGITLLGGLEVPERAARAHEMKNCLSVILAVSRLVEHELSQESRNRLARLLSAAWRLKELLTTDLSGTVSSAASCSPTSPCCVSRIVADTTARIVDRAAEANVELFVQCGGGELLCNEGALREALFNLLANALEASSPGKGVFLATYVTSEGDQYWMVQDTGPGISSERLATVGRPFHSTKDGGSGLGLALARSVIDAHGGVIHIESSSSAGTTVSVWLPREPFIATPPEP